MPEDEAILQELVARASLDAAASGSFGSVASAHQYAMLYALWRKHVPAGAHSLDWGAGNGHFGFFLARSDYPTTAFTLTPVSAMDWVDRPYVSIVSGSSSEPIRLPFGDGSFDAVASIGVLEHVRETGGNELGSLREIARVLRPGGVFVCYHLPNRWSWIEAVAGLVQGKHHHRFRYTSRTIRELADAANLEVVEIKRYGILPRNGLRLVPRALRASNRLANAWDRLDVLTGKVASPVCQNYLVVLRSLRR